MYDRTPLLVGLICLLIAGATVLFAPSRGQLGCEAASAICTLERGSLVFPETVRFAVEQIDHVEVQVKEDLEDGSTRRPAFVLTDGAVEPLVKSWSGWHRYDDEAKQINAWLAAPSGTLSVSVASTWIGWILAAVLTLVGVGLIGASRP